MSDLPSPADPGPTFASTIHDAAAKATPMIEAAAGYRTICLSHGFSPGAAEQMAVSYHHLLIGCAHKAWLRADRR